MGLLRERLQEPGAASIEPGAEDPVDDAYQVPWAPRAWMRPLRKDRAALAGEASAAAAKVEAAPPPIPGPAARKMFGPMDLARMAWGQACYRMRGAENADHIDAAREAALTFVAGHRVDDIVSLCEEIYDDTMADRIWEGTRDLAQRHLEAGQRVWLVTATPVELAGIIASRLGLTGALGTVAESIDGVYTGRLVGGLLHGE